LHIFNTWHYTSSGSKNVSAHRKVAVLGLDGVPYGLLKRLTDNRVMPHLSDIARNGCFMRMRSTIPPVSSVAWTSFMTGCNPGEHGIFGFTDLTGDRISLRLPSFDDIRTPTIWQRIALQGKKSLIVNLPFTYPARPLNGVLVAGFVAPIFERSVYPSSLIPWLQSKNYRVDVDAEQGRRDRDLLMRDLFETLNIREEVMLSLMESVPWDLLVGVITGTDRLHHFFFDAADDPGHPRHSDFTAYYSRIDAFIGRLVERLGNRAHLVLLSDHGFAQLKTQVNVNSLLQKLGYLRYTRPDPSSLEHVHPSSRAFALEPGRVYLNRRERFRNGVLDEAESCATAQRLKAELEEIRVADVDDQSAGEQFPPEDALFLEVAPKDELYSGDSARFAPDLVLIPGKGYDLKATIGAPDLSGKDIFTGTHTHDDAFLILDDPSIGRDLSDPVITDVAPLLMDLLE